MTKVWLSFSEGEKERGVTSVAPFSVKAGNGEQTGRT